MKKKLHLVAVAYMILSVCAWIVTAGSWRYFMMSYVIPCYFNGLDEADYFVFIMGQKDRPGLLPEDVDKRYLIDSDTTLPNAMAIILSVLNNTQNAQSKVYAPVDRDNEIYVSVRSHWEEKIGGDVRWKTSTALIRIQGVPWEPCHVGPDQVAIRQ